MRFREENNQYYSITYWKDGDLSLYDSTHNTVINSEFMSHLPHKKLAKMGNQVKQTNIVKENIIQNPWYEYINFNLMMERSKNTSKKKTFHRIFTTTEKNSTLHFRSPLRHKWRRHRTGLHQTALRQQDFYRSRTSSGNLDPSHNLLYSNQYKYSHV